jgi:hypothetical protein
MSGTTGGSDARSRLRALVRDNLRFLSLSPRGGSGAAKLLEDDAPLVTLQVGQRVFERAARSMRQELWRSALQRHSGEGARAAASYASALAQPCPPEAAADIAKDLARTFPNQRRFASPEGQRSLGRVLRAYAAFDAEIGYCQGMSFIAATLLLVLESEADAFGALVLLLHGRDHALRPYYDANLSALQLHLWQLGRLLPPNLSVHLESLGCLPSLYAASWLMTCFSSEFPSSVSQRVMDVVLSDSSRVDAALLKAAVALVRSRERALMQCSDLEEALDELKRELPAMGEEALHDALTDAFCRPWEARQRRLLASTEGSETVAQAVERVSRVAADKAAGVGEEEEEGAVKEEREAREEEKQPSAEEAAAAMAERLHSLRLAPPPGSGGGQRRSSGSGLPAVAAAEAAAASASAPAADLLHSGGGGGPDETVFVSPHPSAPVHQSSANSFGSWNEASAGAGAAAGDSGGAGAEGTAGAGGGGGDGGGSSSSGSSSDGSFSGLAARHHHHHHHPLPQQRPPPPPPPPEDSLI